jgi:tetratricopeptide (TPR) repeat protein
MSGAVEDGARMQERSGGADGAPTPGLGVDGKQNRSRQPVRQGVGARTRERLIRRRDLPKLAPVWPVVAWRVAGLVIFVMALALLVYEAGKQPSGSGHRGFWATLSAVTTKPAVAIPLASLLVLGLANFVRRLRFEWLAMKPGPIFVHELSVSPDLSNVDVAHLTTAFRRRLMQLRLHAPTAVPATSPAQDFLSVVDGDHLDSKNLLGSAVNILRAAIPTHAYEVSVTLTEEPTAPPGKPRRGVTAQITRLPTEGIPVETAWAYSWDDAIRQAADMVTAAVLPRTVVSNRPPWSGWRGYPMPSLLVHHYERAQELTSQRRYDEALDHYFQALEVDPKNVDLRLHKGFVEEKLELYLDAVVTYAAARQLACHTSKRLYHRKARRNRTASGNIARYRLAVLLGGIRFAHQWRKPDKDTLRDKQRLFLRGRLKPELEELLDDHKLMPSPKRQHLTTLLNEFGTGKLADEHDSRYFELRLLLAHLALKELEDVRPKLVRRGAQPGWLTPLSVDLTMGSLGMRVAYVEHTMAELQSRNASGTSRQDERHAPGGAPTRPGAWIPEPESTLPRPSRPFQTWTEEYNAACLYALPLLVKPPPPGEPDENEARRRVLAEEAVRHLTRAMSSTVSWYAAQRRDWVLSEDPDLDGLRRRLEFKHFEAIYFPSPLRTPRRPRDVHRWQQSCYTNKLLAQTARRWETVWHRRRNLLVNGIDPHAVIQWCEDEADAWRLVECVAKDCRYWRARYDLIEQMKVWSAKYGFEPLAVEVPRFVSEKEANDDDGDAEAKQQMKQNEHRLDEVVERLGAMSGQQNHSRSSQKVQQQGAQLDRLQSELRDRDVAERLASVFRLEQLQRRQLERLQIELQNRDFWNRAAPRHFLPSVCDVHAAMWQRLHEWLDETPDEYSTAGSRFACALSQAARLSGTFHGLWVVAVIDRRVRRLASGNQRSDAKAGNGRSPSYT